MPLDQASKRKLKAFGANVRRERNNRKITQEKLAELSGVYPRTIQKIEAAEMNILLTTVARIQMALDCSWEDLFRDVN